MNYFFTADEHYGHFNVLRYNNRPFTSVDDMTEGLIDRHNKKVSDSQNNLTIHCGDFCWAKRYHHAQEIIQRLNGRHVFLRGSHDIWMNDAKKFFHERWEKRINGQVVVGDHYAMYSWPKSHYGSWSLFGHHHGRLVMPCKAIDVGVDTNNYEPYSFDEIVDIMKTKPNNWNQIE